MAGGRDDFSSVTDTYDNQGAGAATLDDSDLLYDGLLASSTRDVYGRSKETLILLKAYQRLLATKQKQVVVVHGESGSGKTALVNKLRDVVCETGRGFFVSGKFFQPDETVEEEPYSAIMAAFSDLCDLLIQSDDFDEAQRQKIGEALGTDAQLLVKSISNLSPLVGDQLGEVDVELSFAKFKVACKKFLHTLASEQHPIVVFLDDIQWADEGSAQLIQAFLQDLELKNVMFIMAYRNGEIFHLCGEQGVLAPAAATLNHKDIALSNLDSNVVHQIVTSILGSSTEQIRQLSNLVASRTAGNPLHVMFFMETIQREGLLVQGGGNCSWLFDVDKIQQNIMVSDTLAGLLARKIEQLPRDLKEMLKVASLLGYAFDESTLTKVTRSVFEKDDQACEPSSITRLLSNAVDQGFIEKTSLGDYQFTHDTLQSSFRCLVDKMDAPRLHLNIGEAFLEDQGADKSNVYKAAVHLNCARDFVRNQYQRTRLATINLKAARYCTEVSAFGKAATALQQGLTVLDVAEQWSSECFMLTFELMEMLARTQLIVGDLEGCKDTVREALIYCKTTDMTVNLLLIDIEVRMAGNEVNATIAAANRALSVLGVNMPQKPKLRHIVVKLVKVKYMLRRKTDRDILDLPFTQDLLSKKAVKILMYICSYCILRDEADTAVFSALVATELTLKNGLSEQSPCAFAIYGMTEASIGKIDRAYRFGQLSLAMLDRVGSRESECPTVATALPMITSRKERLDQLVIPLHKVANSGFQRGDVVYATYCASQCYSMHVHIGTHLAGLEGAIRSTYERVKELGQDALLRWLQPVLQYVMTMQTDVNSWEHIAVLSGEVMNEEEYFNEALETNHAVFNLICLLWKAKLAVEFGQYSLAATTLDRCKLYGVENLRLSWSGPAYYFDQALTQYGLYELSGRRRHMKAGRKFKRLLERMDAADCPNASPFVAFLGAQEFTLRKKRVDETELRAAYDYGLDFLVESKNTHLEGLLNERAGFDFAKLGLRTEAQRHFDRALHIYQDEWGAIAKYNHLKMRSSLTLSRLRVEEGSPKPLTGTCISIP